MAKRKRQPTLWSPFQPGKPITLTGCPDIDTREVYLNSRYQVFVYRRRFSGMAWLHLSIKRHDRKPVRDWRDMQRIKNELCGTECEAVELYPAESRCMDTANQFHLWVTPPGVRAPFGFTEGRMVTTPEDQNKDQQLAEALMRQRGIKLDLSQSKQRAFEPHHTLDGCHEVGPVWCGEAGRLEDIVLMRDASIDVNFARRCRLWVEGGSA